MCEISLQYIRRVFFPFLPVLRFFFTDIRLKVELRARRDYNIPIDFRKLIPGISDGKSNNFSSILSVLSIFFFGFLPHLSIYPFRYHLSIAQVPCEIIQELKIYLNIFRKQHAVTNKIWFFSWKMFKACADIYISSKTWLE